MSDTTTAPPTKLYQALLAAQREMGPVLKNSTNPGFRSKYADLPSVLDTVDEPLHAHGLLVVQRLAYISEPDNNTAVLVTELIHAESGEKIESIAPVMAKDPTDPQKFGSALTYYRRYSLLALLGLAPEDDDGNAASQPPRSPKAAPTRSQPLSATEAPNDAPQALHVQPPARASRSDDDYLAIVNDDTRIPERRVQAAKLFVSGAKDAAGVHERVLRLTSLPLEERDAIRDAALDYLRAKVER